jgi:hypothetical protein
VRDSKLALDRIWNKGKDCIFDQPSPDADAITSMRVLVSTTKHTTISPLWVRLHADKIGPSYTPQGGINMQTDKVAGKADLNLLLEFKARHKCLNFPEHHIQNRVQQNHIRQTTYNHENAIQLLVFD